MAAILVAYHQAGVLADIEGVLRDAGHTVATATTHPDALERLEAAAFDIVVCGVGGTGLNGLNVWEAVRARPGPPRFVALVPSVQYQTAINDAQAAGITDMLILPFTAPELLRHIDPTTGTRGTSDS